MPEGTAESPRLYRMIRSKLRLRDVLRADVPAIYGALARDEAGDDRLVRRTYRFVHWLERGSTRDVRAYLVTPLPLLWAWRAGDGAPASRIHTHYLRAVWRGAERAGESRAAAGAAGVAADRAGDDCMVDLAQRQRDPPPCRQERARGR